MFRLIPVVRPAAKLVQKRNFWHHRDINGVINEMERRMNDIERDFFGGSIISRRLLPIDGVPPQKFHVDVNVNGFRPEDIKISLKDKVLKIEANYEGTEKDGAKWKRSLVKEVSVPDDLDISSVESFLHQNGTLRIEADLKKEDTASKIPIDKGEKQAINS